MVKQAAAEPCPPLLATLPLRQSRSPIVHLSRPSQMSRYGMHCPVPHSSLQSCRAASGSGRDRVPAAGVAGIPPHVLRSAQTCTGESRPAPPQGRVSNVPLSHRIVLPCTYPSFTFQTPRSSCATPLPKRGSLPDLSHPAAGCPLPKRGSLPDLSPPAAGCHAGPALYLRHGGARRCGQGPALGQEPATPGRGIGGGRRAAGGAGLYSLHVALLCPYG